MDGAARREDDVESSSDSEELNLLGSALAEAVDEDEDESGDLSGTERELLISMETLLVIGSTTMKTEQLPKRLARIQRWLDLVQVGDYVSVLRETPNALRRAPSFLERQAFEHSAESSPLLQMVISRATKYAAKSECAQFEVLVLSVAGLRAYEQANYSGPALEDIKIFDLGMAKQLQPLEFAGETPSPLCTMSEALLLARGTSMALSSRDKIWSADWWAARAASYHWRALVATKSSGAARAKLWEECQQSMDKVCALPLTHRKDLSARARLERGLIAHHFDEESRGKKHFFAAAELAGLEIELTGGLGKRTKYQQKSLPQLKLKTNLDVVSVETEAKPEIISLDQDSVLLENGIHFDDDDAKQRSEDFSVPARPEEVALRQAIVLALCLDVKNSNPEKEGLTAQEMRAYVDAACTSAQNWMVFSTALLLKSRLEAASTYSADRAALQLEVLVSQHGSLATKEDDARLERDDAPAVDRLAFLSALDYPAIWEAKNELAYAMMNLGALVSAAEQFAAISQWDNVVECYAAAGRRSEALRVLKAQEKTPNLLCVLAEIQDEAIHFETAWHDSQYRSARAARGLGRYYARAKQWSLAAEWFTKALAVAPHAPATWFDTGIAYMRLAFLEDNEADARWREAARCFSRAAAQEPDDADSWANLAAVLIQARDLKPAASALDAAIRLRPDDWRLWENATRVYLALHRPAQAIQALNKLLDLRTRSKRSIDSYLEQFDLVSRQVAALEADTVDLPPSQAAKFNATAAAKALDAYVLRLKREAPASPGLNFARLWALCADRVALNINSHNLKEKEPLLREFKARQLRALLADFHDDNASTEEMQRLLTVALEFAHAHDHAAPSDRSSASLLLRNIADRARLPLHHEVRTRAAQLEIVSL